MNKQQCLDLIDKITESVLSPKRSEFVPVAMGMDMVRGVVALALDDTDTTLSKPAPTIPPAAVRILRELVEWEQDPDHHAGDLASLALRAAELLGGQPAPLLPPDSPPMVMVEFRNQESAFGEASYALGAVCYGPFSRVDFVGEALVLQEDDYKALGIDDDEDDFYPEFALASAAETGQWFLRTTGTHYHELIIGAMEGPRD